MSKDGIVLGQNGVKGQGVVMPWVQSDVYIDESLFFVSGIHEDWIWGENIELTFNLLWCGIVAYSVLTWREADDVLVCVL